MSVGQLRVTAHRPFRRAGFVFGPEPRLLAATALTPPQLLAIVREPMLKAEITHDGETWYTPPAEFVAGLVALVEATDGMTVEAIRERLDSGMLDLDPIIQRAMRGEPAPVDAPIGGVDSITAIEAAGAMAEGAIAGAEPGRGAGADHPGATSDIVPQPVIDPNPALPAAGGTSAAGVSVRAAPDVATETADQPRPVGELARDIAQGDLTPAAPAVDLVRGPKRKPRGG